MFILDACYGIGRHPWDVAPTKEDVDLTFDQLAACTSGTSMVGCIWHHPNQYNLFNDAMEEKGFSDTHIISWYKYNQNVEGHHQYTYSTEQLLVGYKGGRHKCNWLTDPNPLKRHNIIIGPTLSVFWKDDKGEVVNFYQKPAYLARWLCGNHLEPGENVMILGGGVGGDIAGVVANGNNCFVVENDPKQFLAMISKLTTNIADYDRRLEEDKDDPKDVYANALEIAVPDCQKPGINVLDLLQAAKKYAGMVNAMTDENQALKQQLDEVKNEVKNEPDAEGTLTVSLSAAPGSPKSAAPSEKASEEASQEVQPLSQTQKEDAEAETE
jgi:hypothetical protein